MIQNKQLVTLHYGFTQLSKVKVSGKLALNIARIMRKIEEASEIFEAARMQTLKTIAMKNTAGEIIFDEKGKAKFESDQDAVKWENEYKSMIETDCKTLEGEEIMESDLSNVMIEPEILFHLLPLIKKG